MSVNKYNISDLNSYLDGNAENGNNTATVKSVPDSFYQKDGLVHTGLLGVEYFMPVKLNNWQLPNEPVISISGKKTIVETPLAGNSRRGTVKELINTEDYEIKIKGVIINEKDDAYPLDEVAKLVKLFELNKSILIVNMLTDRLEITQVVIRSLDLPEMVGVQNAQSYVLSCVSDEDFILVKS